MQGLPTNPAPTTRRELASDCNALELSNGKAISLVGLSDNEINTNSYLSNNVLLRLLFKLLNPCPLSLIIASIVVALVPESQAYPLWMYLSEFALVLLLIIVKEVYFDMMRRRADEKINQSRFLMKDSKVYRDGEELTGLTWGDIREGDVLYLQKGEKAPADLLILDTQYIEDRQAVVYVDARSITGKVTVERKKASYLTQVTSRSAVKRNWDKYRKEYLTGKMKYQHPNANMQDFLGYLKLVKDPKTSQITFENFISRQSIIKTCWIYALVLHAGMNCKIMRHIRERNRSHRFFQNRIDKVFAIFLVISLVLGLPFALLGMTAGDYQSLIISTSYHFLIFSSSLPHFLYVGKILLLLYFSLKNSIDAEIMNFSSIIKFGQIDYAVIAYNGVLSSGKMSVDEIITASSLYDFREDVQGFNRGSRRMGSISAEDKFAKKDGNREKRGNKFFMSICSGLNNINPINEKQLTITDFDTYFLDDDYKQDTNNRIYTGRQSTNPTKFRMQLQPLKISKEKLSNNIKNEEEQSIELIKAFGICHQAILKSVDAQDIKFEANSRIYSEEVLLRLVNTTGVHVSSQIDTRSKKQVGLRFKLLDSATEWLFSRRINNFQLQRKIFSVVVHEENSEQRTLYCKGTPQDMLDKLRDKQLRKNTIQNKLLAFKNSKAQIIIYGKKVLSNEQSEQYEAEFTKLKMSSTITSKDLQDFSAKFEKDLEFVCMVGLSSQKSASAKEMAQYLTQKGIKMCIFTNNISEIQSLKTLLHNQDKNEKQQYVELEGNTVQEINYNLNSITRKLNNEKEYNFSLVIGPQCWNLLKIHSSLMQHFLFAAYYTDNILTHGFSPREKAQITEKLKNDYNKPHTLMSIGSSFSDLLFENYSDVSLIISSCEGQRIHSDIPSDIRAPTISSLKSIIELSYWVTSAYNFLIDASVYRSVIIVTVAFIIETTVYATQGSSYNFNGTLTGLYVVVYGLIETIFTIKFQQKKEKTLAFEKLKDKEFKINFFSNIIEAIIHGVTITVTVMHSLPNARLPGGKLFPVQSIHFSIYFLLVSVSIFRHAIKGYCSKAAVIALAVPSYIILLGSVWLFVLVDDKFIKIACQMTMLLQSYDSAFMCINAMIFCLACSLFIAETHKKGMIGFLASYYSDIKKGSSGKSKRLITKDINYIQLVKHLFKDEDNIEESIQQLVKPQFDINQLKITPFLEIKKLEHRIKNQFNNAPLNLVRFQITIFVVCAMLITEIIHSAVFEQISAVSLTPLFIEVAFLLVGLYWLGRNNQKLARKYYQGAEICLTFLCLMAIIAQISLRNYNTYFLLSCLTFVILTQLIGVRIWIIVLLSIACLITGIVLCFLTEQNQYLKIFLQLLFICANGFVNIFVLYGSTLDSRKNFILREQIEMQTNQTNDIWTILVPEFVRNFFAESGQEGGQYKENHVAILFCYVCNFDSILEEQGRNVVRILDDLYREFDKLCSSFAVQKIQTVGYTYMAATGIKKIESQMENEMVRKNKVDRLVNMAQQMIDKTKLFKWGAKKNKDLEIKVGIHVGEVVVGVIGKHKKQFSLIGTNVNTCSRHCSTGNNGSLTLSRPARQELHNIPEQAFTKKQVWMKGLCKTKDQTITVFMLKGEQARKRTNNKSINNYKSKFKQLVMKIIRSQRLKDDVSSEDEQILQSFINLDHNPLLNVGVRQTEKRRTTCRGLENNFTKIQEMKNRQDELKYYSNLLEFDIHLAKQYFGQIAKSKDEMEVLLKKEEQFEKEFCLDLQKNRKFRNKLFIVIVFLLNSIFLIINIFLVNYISNTEIAVRAIGIAMVFALFFLVDHLHRHKIIFIIFIAVFIYSLTFQTIDEINTISQDYRTFSHFYVMMIVTMFLGISGIRFVHSLIICLLAFAYGFVAAALQQTLSMNALYQWFYILLILIRKFAFQKQSIINFRQGRKTAQISNELSKIVSELLPKHAYEKLKTQNFQNRLQLTDLFEQCTILFADIKGFTQFSDRPQNRKQPQNVVRMLRSLFQQFDVLCTEKNVYKVYTIGDCYVVLGFTNCYDRNPIREAQNVVSFAFDMLKKIDEVKKQKPSLDCLNMRIGIHTGTIIGGIVGTEIVRYDIYGSDVVVANKFEETGKTGEIHISEETKKLLDQLEKKPFSENNIYPSEKVEVKKLNISYGGYFIKRGNLS